jgi:hypothetical protein
MAPESSSVRNGRTECSTKAQQPDDLHLTLADLFYGSGFAWTTLTDLGAIPSR